MDKLIDMLFTKDYKRDNGIYFTRDDLRRRLLKLLPKDFIDKKIDALEPSFGKGDFLIDIYYGYNCPIYFIYVF